LTIRAFGDQIVPPVIIFKGKGQQQTVEEMQTWAKLNNVVVYYQTTGWCDSTFFRWYLENVFYKYIRESGDLDDQLLFLDNYGAHKTSPSLQLMEELGIVPMFLAKNCTDVSAPVDHHVGALLKYKIKLHYEADLELNYNLWRGCGDEGVFSVLSESARRMKMATWLDVAWVELRGRHSFFVKAFVSTGCLMGLRGENGIKMRDLNEALGESVLR